MQGEGGDEETVGGFLRAVTENRERDAAEGFGDSRREMIPQGLVVVLVRDVVVSIHSCVYRQVPLGRSRWPRGGAAAAKEDLGGGGCVEIRKQPVKTGG